MSSWHGGQRRTLCGADVRSRQPGARSLSPGAFDFRIRRLEDVSFERVVPANRRMARPGRRPRHVLHDWRLRATLFGSHPAAGKRRPRDRQSHPDTRHFSLLGASDVRREPDAAHETLMAAAGKAPRGFRALGSRRRRRSSRLSSISGMPTTRPSCHPGHADAEACLSCRGSGVGLPVIPRVLWMRQGPQVPSPESRPPIGLRHRDSPLLEIPITTGSMFQWPLIYGLHFERTIGFGNGWSGVRSRGRSCDGVP